MAAETTPQTSPDTATAVVVRPSKSPPRTDRLPPFRVLLHNDDTNTPEDVTLALIEICFFQEPRAVLVMKEANDSGVALVMVTHKERAELLVEQFTSKQLTATMEPAE